MSDPNIIIVDRTFQHVTGIGITVALYLLSLGFLLGIRWALRKLFRRLTLPLSADTHQSDIFLLWIDKRAALFALIFCAVSVLPPLMEIGFTQNAKNCDPKTFVWYLQTLVFSLSLPLVLLLVCRSAYLSLRHSYPLKLSRTDRIFHTASKLFYLVSLYAAFGVLMSSMYSSWPCEISPVMMELGQAPYSNSTFTSPPGRE